MGESSVVIVKMPSNLRSGKGAVTEAEMRARTLRLNVNACTHIYQLHC